MKQRLIGGAVLVALAVLLLPVFFDGAGVEQTPTVEFAIPPRPGIRDVPPLEPIEVPAAAEPAGETRSEVGKSTESAAPTEAEPEASVDPELGAWVVQLGSFSREANALGLRTRLRESGFDAFITRHANDGTVSYRVRVGPEQNKSHAENLRRRLAEAGHPGILVGYP